VIDFFDQPLVTGHMVPNGYRADGSAVFQDAPLARAHQPVAVPRPGSAIPFIELRRRLPALGAGPSIVECWNLRPNQEQDGQAAAQMTTRRDAEQGARTAR